MRIYILPISGGEFPNQLALLSEVTEALMTINAVTGEQSYAPDLLMGASGGNISAYLALASDWTYTSIIKNCYFVNQSLFIRDWEPKPLRNFIPGFASAVLHGSLYRAGGGATSLFETFFNRETIVRSEILTLTFNQTKLTPQIFSNRSEEESFFKNQDFNVEDEVMYDVDSITYNDGDIVRCAEATVASYSIPLITQPQEISGDSHADGGVSFASPLTPTYQKIVQNIFPSLIAQGKKLQIIYFSSYDMNDPSVDRTSFYGNSTIAKSLAQLLQSSILQDRSIIKTILLECGVRVVFSQGNKINTPELVTLLSQLKNKHYSLILYPTGAPYIKIFSFTPEDIIKTINESRQNYNFILWSEE